MAQDRTTKAKLREIMDHKQQVIEQQATEIAQLKTNRAWTLGEHEKQVAELKKTVARSENREANAYAANARIQDRVKVLLDTIKNLTGLPVS